MQWYLVSNVCKILYADVVQISGSNYALIAQEIHANGSITNKLNSHNFLPLGSALKAIREILCGLEYLHYNSIIHNDIKPSNILINSNNQALLTDYGISGVSPACGPTTPKNAYILHRAPETATATPTISHSTDIFQLGITLFRLLNGITTIESEFARLGQAQFEAVKASGKLITKSSHLPFIPQAVKRVIEKSTNPDPSKRFASALEMRREVEKLNYAGSWDVDSTGNYIGVGNEYEYRYEISAKPNSQFDLIAYKKNKKSGRETKIKEYTHLAIDEKAKTSNMQQFMLWVVENAS